MQILLTLRFYNLLDKYLAKMVINLHWFCKQDFFILFFPCILCIENENVNIYIFMEPRVIFLVHYFSIHSETEWECHSLTRLFLFMWISSMFITLCTRGPAAVLATPFHSFRSYFYVASLSPQIVSIICIYMSKIFFLYVAFAITFS